MEASALQGRRARLLQLSAAAVRYSARVDGVGGRAGAGVAVVCW